SPEMYLHELQDWLAQEHANILVAVTTLDRNIHEAGLTYKFDGQQERGTKG
ncbi:hypothetical protein K439DRAFT_1365518, partial [Ramaria rubella]